MANQNILTYGLKVSQLKQDYFSPSVFLANTTTPVESLYCFLSRVDPWPYDSNPPAPTQDQQYIKNVFKNMFVAKAITSNNITPVARRIDWTSGQVYDYYQDNVDMLAVDQNDFLIKSFYIKNRYDQVFKCLWNNNGGASTVEPFFKPGNYGLNNIFQDSDGYKWKYMYTIDVGSKKTFMDSDWIPVPIGSHTPNPLESTAGRGDIEVINVLDGGDGYPSDGSVEISITGDGINATASPVIENGITMDWRQMAVEFLYWSDQGWGPGSLINLNPTATSLVAVKEQAIVDSVLAQTVENLILDQNRTTLPVRPATLFTGALTVIEPEAMLAKFWLIF